MKPVLRLFSVMVVLGVFLPGFATAQAFTDVKKTTYEYSAINMALAKGWMKPQTATAFGYGTPISPDEWLYMLMFLRTSDACPELGMKPTEYWLAENIRTCLSGAGVPVATASPTQIRRDEAMQQLFALRRQSFAFQKLQSEPEGYVPPLDKASIAANRLGAMIAADRLKLIFRSKKKLLPAAPLLREDAALSVTRFVDWETQGGVDKETKNKTVLNPYVELEHWQDLDTDIYVVQVKGGGDAEIKPIMPPRSFNPAVSTSTPAVRDEFVYEPVSNLAKNAGAMAAVNGSYFNVQWPWGALEDVAMVEGKTLLSRTDRSTFTVCENGLMYVGAYDLKKLKAEKCVPKHALGAGPMFMANGAVLATSTNEGFDEYTQWERRVGSNARTAVAVSADHKTAYLIVVAGKSYPAFGRGGSSLGAFLKGKYPELNDAMMYDGGGSTALYANGKTLVGSGESGNQTERAVLSALGVFSKKAEALASKRFKKDQAKAWDAGVVTVKQVKPSGPFAWQSAKSAKGAGVTVGLSGSRGSTVKVMDAEDHVQVYNFTFDLIAQDATSSLTVARREGLHENGWRIPTEIHVLNPKDKSDTDVVKLLAFLPAKEKPDLKTFDAVGFARGGVVFGDASGKTWYYYAKDKQFSPAKYVAPTVKKKGKK